MRALLSHSMYCYSRSVQVPISKDNFLFIVGHFFYNNNDVDIDEAEYLVRKRLSDTSWELENITGEWSRGPDGMVTQASASISSMDGIKTVLGMSHSGIRSEVNRYVVFFLSCD